jgi:hypothetical protein
MNTERFGSALLSVTRGDANDAVGVNNWMFTIFFPALAVARIRKTT